jgi:glycosidase
VAYVTQNLFGSHDSNRIGSHIVNRGIGNFRDWGKYFELSVAANNPNYQVRKPNAEEIRLQKLFVIFQMTYVGAPMVYYGDEVGMWGGNDPDDRKPMIWEDITYEDEVTNPDGSKRPADKVAVNKTLQQHYRTLIQIRNRLPALQLGDFNTLLIDDNKGLYGFERSYLQQRVRVILNNSDQPQRITLKHDNLRWQEQIEALPITVSGEQIQLTIPAKWGAVLLAQ